MNKELVSFRFDPELKAQLAALAEVTGRSQTFLAEEALREYCARQAWQVDAINEGLAQADRGDFAEHASVKQKWVKKRADLLDERSTERS